jgi:hypothetical protein
VLCYAKAAEAEERKESAKEREFRAQMSDLMSLWRQVVGRQADEAAHTSAEGQRAAAKKEEEEARTDPGLAAALLVDPAVKEALGAAGEVKRAARLPPAPATTPCALPPRPSPPQQPALCRPGRRSSAPRTRCRPPRRASSTTSSA